MGQEGTNNNRLFDFNCHGPWRQRLKVDKQPHLLSLLQ